MRCTTAEIWSVRMWANRGGSNGTHTKHLFVWFSRFTHSHVALIIAIIFCYPDTLDCLSMCSNVMVIIMAKNETLDEIGMVQSGERRQRSCQPKGLMCVQNPFWKRISNWKYKIITINSFATPEFVLLLRFHHICHRLETESGILCLTAYACVAHGSHMFHQSWVPTMNERTNERIESNLWGASYFTILGSDIFFLEEP